MAMSAKDKRMADMKRRFAQTSPSKNIGQSITQRVMNDIFGKKKSMGIDDDPKAMLVQKAKKKIADSKNKNKKTNTTKKTFGMSPGALGGKLKSSTKKTTTNNTKKTTSNKNDKITQGSTMTKIKNPSIVTKEQLKKSGLSLRDYMNFMQGKTRRDDKKKKTTVTPKKVNLKASQMPKKKPTMVDDFSKSKVKKKKTSLAKTGYGSKAMSTKTPKTYKGTNITPTKLQRDRMRKRMMGST